MHNFRVSRNSIKGELLGDPLAGDHRVGRKRISLRLYDPVTTAAGIGGATSLIGGLNASDAASSAASTQAAAANRASDLQNAQWQQTQRNLQPYLSLGSSAINPMLKAMGYNVTQSTPQESYDQVYQRLLPQFTRQGSSGSPSGSSTTGLMSGNNGGFVTVYDGTGSDSDTGRSIPVNQLMGGMSPSVDTAGLNAAVQSYMNGQLANSYGNYTVDPNNILQQNFSAPTAEQAAQTPGYQFTLDQGLKSTQNGYAARGLGASGAAMKGAAGYATGLADNTYNDVFNRALNTFNTNYSSAANRVNRLSNLVTGGQNAASGLGTLGMNAVGQIGNTIQGGANATASGIIGGANALTGAMNGIGNSATLYGLMQNNASRGGGGNAYGANVYGNAYTPAQAFPVTG